MSALLLALVLPASAAELGTISSDDTGTVHASIVVDAPAASVRRAMADSAAMAAASPEVKRAHATPTCHDANLPARRALLMRRPCLPLPWLTAAGLERRAERAAVRAARLLWRRRAWAGGQPRQPGQRAH